MGVLNVRLVIVILAVTLAGLTMAAFGSGKTVSSCKHSWTVRDFVPVAKKAWKRPDAPTKRYKHIYRRFQVCAQNEQTAYYIKKVSKKYKDKYRSVRQLKRTGEKCDHGAIKQCIKYGAVKEHYDYGTMLAIASCESGLNPHVTNPSSGAGGLFQFIPSTWAANKYARYSRYHPKWASLGAAWKMRRDGTGEWVCQA